jgi:hypothetical protein
VPLAAPEAQESDRLRERLGGHDDAVVSMNFDQGFVVD